jgi:gliding motility-associated-like protein
MGAVKKIAAAILLLVAGDIDAQITITKNDMPNAGDTIRLSVKTSLANFQPASTGANYTWDFSNLVPDSQRLVKCVNGAATSYSVPYAFLASYGIYNYTPDQFPWSLAGAPATNVYDFYKKTTNYLAILGQGMTLQGQAIPALYSGGTADVVYKFPLNYLNQDTSKCNFGAPIPGIGYYRKNQTRINEVDGWGTLITPQGTFNTLRVKSTLIISDSIYLDTLGFGFTIPRQNIVEYKWLAAGKKIPVLEIDVTMDLLNINFTVNRVNWQDNYMAPINVTFSGANSCPILNEGVATATISGGKPPYTYSWSTGDTTLTIDSLAPGNYVFSVTDANGWHKNFVDSIKTLKDSSCMIWASFYSVRTCPKSKDGSLTATVTGARLPAKYLWSTGDTTLTIDHLPVGTYTLYITDKFNRKDTAYTAVEPSVGDARCLNIPNAFTPDGDGTNDVWNVRALSEFPDCKVEIFNQWGSLVFRSNGYDTPWDGKYNGEPSPSGAYYFVIDLGNGAGKYSGTVTIIR